MNELEDTDQTEARLEKFGCFSDYQAQLKE
jgi:hypothetical protein